MVQRLSDRYRELLPDCRTVSLQGRDLHVASRFKLAHHRGRCSHSGCHDGLGEGLLLAERSKLSCELATCLGFRNEARKRGVLRCPCLDDLG